MAKIVEYIVGITLDGYIICRHFLENHDRDLIKYKHSKKNRL